MTVVVENHTSVSLYTEAGPFSGQCIFCFGVRLGKGGGGGGGLGGVNMPQNGLKKWGHRMMITWSWSKDSYKCQYQYVLWLCPQNFTTVFFVKGKKLHKRNYLTSNYWSFLCGGILMTGVNKRRLSLFCEHCAAIVNIPELNSRESPFIKRLAGLGVIPILWCRFERILEMEGLYSFW